MTHPSTPAECETELRRIRGRLEAQTDTLAGLLQTAAKADVAYRLAYAKALLRATGDTVSEREAAAVLACADQLTERKTTEAVADAAREAVRSLRDQLGAPSSRHLCDGISKNEGANECH
jgi:hypothetical protein